MLFAEGILVFFLFLEDLLNINELVYLQIHFFFLIF